MGSVWRRQSVDDGDEDVDIVDAVFDGVRARGAKGDLLEQWLEKGILVLQPAGEAFCDEEDGVEV